jgi:alpha-ketoglutarate-dependent taurine dioxygenase
MAKDIYTLKPESYSRVVEAIPELVKTYKERGVFVIKGYNFSIEEHKNLARLLGDNLDWHINSSIEDSQFDRVFAHGGHSDNPNREYNNDINDYVLDWHIEQVFYKCPPLAGIWCMKDITCAPGSGNTLFADSNEIYESLSDEDKEFLSGAIVSWDKPANNHVGPFYTKAIDKHPITSDPIIRVETDRGCYVMPALHSLNNRSATPDEVKRFKEIMSSIKTRLTGDHELRYVQQWEPGDIIVVDLFRMYHAVLGGFKYNERSMDLIVARSPFQCEDVYNDPNILIG